MTKVLEVETPADAEGSVNWDAAKEFFTGKVKEAGETTDDSEAANEPEFVEFSIKGKKIRVKPEEAALLEELRKQARGENGRLGSELAQTKERLARLEGALTTRQPEVKSEPALQPPDPSLAITDFKEWDRQNRAYHKAEMEALASSLEKKYLAERDAERQQATRAEKDQRWADKFYATYGHLNDPAIKPTVSSVYVEHKAEIDAYGDDVEAAHERLAELADERLVVLKKAGRAAGNGNRPPRIESSASPTPRSKVTDAPRVANGESWSARERARMRGETLKQ